MLQWVLSRAHFKKACVNIGVRKIIFLIANFETVCPEKLWKLHLWRFSEVNWTVQSRWSWPCRRHGVEEDEHPEVPSNLKCSLIPNVWHWDINVMFYSLLPCSPLILLWPYKDLFDLLPTAMLGIWKMKCTFFRIFQSWLLRMAFRTFWVIQML